ncbi:MAG TPA: lasso peptide biosynthesis B2 protein [Chloroflexota bacterium]|nr:lasso peptide biosynthesis B2 protein [Chloroflexota bacterium]
MLVHRLGRLASLSRSELFDLLHAQWALAYAQFLVRTRPTGQLVSPASPAGKNPSTPSCEALASRLSLAVVRAAEHGLFRPACLVRAIALHRMLEARGIRGSRICVGVRYEQRRFAAHAWVEYGDQVLGDHAAYVGAFAPLIQGGLEPPS